MNQLSEVNLKPAEFARHYMDELCKLLTSVDFEMIAKVASTFETARQQRKRIFFIGNGGSAATATHFANDLASVPPPTNQSPFKSISLTDSISAITALGNDTGYDNIFVGQMKNLFETGDVLVAISASGNSPNIISAVEYANKNQGIVIGLSGFDGGKLRTLSTLCVHVQTPKGAYGPVEDIHLVLDHLITTYIRQSYMNGK
jgi:D-sedoheptulose 7-phosphate isomerase